MSNTQILQNTTTTGQAISGLGRTWSRPRHIPGPDGLAFKTESRRDGLWPNTLERWTVWHKPDPRTVPHTHPWPFVSKIVKGGYKEARWTRNEESGQWEFVGDFWYKEGDIVIVGKNDAHCIIELLPGTVTHMLIGALFAGPQDWGHVNLLTHEVEKSKASKAFLDALADLNTDLPEVTPAFQGAFALLAGISDVSSS